MPAWLWPAIAGGASLISSALGVREARQNREFQERMSSTAHQREVEDLIKAGLNPALSAMRGGGASTPSGSMADVAEAGGKAVANALAVKQAQANIELTRANAAYVRTQDFDLQTQANSGRYAKLQSEAELADLSVQERQKLLPLAVERARAEIANTLSSARAHKAGAILDELMRSGYVNESEFQEFVGQAGPWGRVVANLVKVGAGAAGATAVLKGAKKGVKPININIRK